MWKYKGKEYEELYTLTEAINKDMKDGQLYAELYEMESGTILQNYWKEIAQSVVECMVEQGIIEEVD